MKRILVLAGGSSDEAEVSLRSGEAVARALSAVSYQVDLMDPAKADWRPVVAQYDAIFPALHGAGGEDGQIQKTLESLAVPFVGSDSVASELCFDKWHYRQAVTANGILMPRGELVDTASFASSPLSRQPFVLKPVDGGSSVDTLIARAVSDVRRAQIESLFARHPQMLLEELISGTEITVGTLGEEALPVVEIIPPADEEFDYENKYNGASQELCPPRNVGEAVQLEAQSIALKVHKLCGCRDLARSDFIVTATGEIYLLETNTMPGLTGQSLLPKAAAAAGWPMPRLCDKLVKMALARV